MDDSVYVGNAGLDAALDRGWLMGHFKDTGDPRHSTDVEIKWGVHPPGDERAEWVKGERRTALLVLISGRFRVELPGRSVLLAHQGDYVVWGRDVDHSWRAEEESTVLTVRWPSVPGYRVPDDTAPLDGATLRADPTRWAEFTASATRLLGDLVAGGAAFGWVEPPTHAEVFALLDHVAAAEPTADGALRAAHVDGRLAGLGYWLRRTRPTHRPHADLEKLAVSDTARGRGIGRAITDALIADARRARVEVLTLDARGDNAAALRLYRAAGFVEYGRLPDFVAVGERRHDAVLFMLDLRVPA